MRIADIPLLLENAQEDNGYYSEDRDVRDALLFLFGAIADDTAFPVKDMKINGNEYGASGMMVLGATQESEEGTREVGYRLIASADGRAITVKMLPVDSPLDAPGKVVVFDGGFSDFREKEDELVGYFQRQSV
jgi:hypothetical protein